MARPAAAGGGQLSALPGCRRVGTLDVDLWLRRGDRLAWFRFTPHAETMERACGHADPGPAMGIMAHPGLFLPRNLCKNGPGRIPDILNWHTDGIDRLDLALQQHRGKCVYGGNMARRLRFTFRLEGGRRKY